jgi:hypothetical protein
MSAALQMAERQRRYSRLHHLHRLAWLGESSPVWSCGAPLLASEITEMTKASRNALAESGAAFNHVDLGDIEYVAVLDAFERTA